METLIFKNEWLRSLITITRNATLFQSLYPEAIAAYERITGKRFHEEVDLTRFLVHRNPTIWLVKDVGIYLATAAIIKKHLLIPNKCYAEGYLSDCPEIIQKCKKICGGSYFIRSIQLSSKIYEGVQKGGDLWIKVYKKNIEVKVKFPEVRKLVNTSSLI